MDEGKKKSKRKGERDDPGKGKLINVDPMA